MASALNLAGSRRLFGHTSLGTGKTSSNTTYRSDLYQARPLSYQDIQIQIRQSMKVRPQFGMYRLPRDKIHIYNARALPC
jgi:hypothetical protein